VSPEGFLDSATEKGERLAAVLAKLGERYGPWRGAWPRPVAGPCTWQAVAAKVAAKAFEAGLLLNAPRPDSLRYAKTVEASRIAGHVCRPDERHQKNPRISSAIGLTWVSSAKCPVSRKTMRAFGMSRLKASAPGGMKNRSFFPQIARSFGCLSRKKA
jgi:hypothetical protein